MLAGFCALCGQPGLALDVPAAISPRDVLAVATSQVGVKESPAGSNRQKYGAEFGWNGVSWCGEFVWWVFRECGIDLRLFGFPNMSMASTNAVDSLARKQPGWTVISRAQARQGDLVIFDFGVTGAGDPADDADHIGICSRDVTGTRIYTIDGNTSLAGSQSNGGEVMERDRALTLVKTVLRPPYAAWTAKLKESEMPTADDLWNANVIAIDGQPKPKSGAELLRVLLAARADEAKRDATLLATVETLAATVKALNAGSPEAVQAAFTQGMARLDARLAEVRVNVSLA
jgi:CHAP domain